MFESSSRTNLSHIFNEKIISVSGLVPYRHQINWHSLTAWTFKIKPRIPTRFLAPKRVVNKLQFKHCQLQNVEGDQEVSKMFKESSWHEGRIRRRMQDWTGMQDMRVVFGSPSDQPFLISGFVTGMLNPIGISSRSKHIVYTRIIGKKCQYSSGVLDIERRIFTPLIFTSTGGMTKQWLNHHSRLVELIAIKKGEDYAKIITWIRARTSFALLRSALTCRRGTRTTVRKSWDFRNNDIEIENTEGAIYSSLWGDI